MLTSIGSESAPVVTVRGENELMTRAGHLFSATRSEFLCAASDASLWARAGAHRAATERLEAKRARKVVIRKLYNPAAVADPRDAAELTRMSRLVRIRICPTRLVHETIIIDRRIAILAGAPVAGEREFSVVSAPDVVAGIRSLYLATWQGATELADFLPTPPPDVDQQGLDILRLLSAGQKDESAARELGLSLRTYRRRVAELMTLLGAESRFQAGARARALGLRF